MWVAGVCSSSFIPPPPKTDFSLKHQGIFFKKVNYFHAFRQTAFLPGCWATTYVSEPPVFLRLLGCSSEGGEAVSNGFKTVLGVLCNPELCPGSDLQIKHSTYRRLDPARLVPPSLEEVPPLQACSTFGSGDAPPGRATLTVGALQLTPP